MTIRRRRDAATTGLPSCDQRLDRVLHYTFVGSSQLRGGFGDWSLARFGDGRITRRLLAAFARRCLWALATGIRFHPCGHGPKSCVPDRVARAVERARSPESVPDHGAVI